MELYDLPQGAISVAYNDTDRCIGTLELDPGAELDRHNRPVAEQLIQLQGSCVMNIWEDGEKREVRLDEGDELEIPADRDHQHTNPTGEPSVTMWRFDGDIRDIIADIRDEFDPV